MGGGQTLRVLDHEPGPVRLRGDLERRPLRRERRGVGEAERGVPRRGRQGQRDGQAARDLRRRQGLPRWPARRRWPRCWRSAGSSTRSTSAAAATPGSTGGTTSTSWPRSCSADAGRGGADGMASCPGPAATPRKRWTELVASAQPDDSSPPRRVRLQMSPFPRVRGGSYRLAMDRRGGGVSDDGDESRSRWGLEKVGIGDERAGRHLRQFHEQRVLADSSVAATKTTSVSDRNLCVADERGQQLELPCRPLTRHHPSPSTRRRPRA